MNGTINDGGAAFPTEQSMNPDGQWNQTGYPGMTLRDYFAGQAMAGLLANNYNNASVPGNAECAYEMADAMLAAREEQK